jgi:hypothetical protein
VNDNGALARMKFAGLDLFAFEHTVIEPFKGHIRSEVNAPTHFGPIREMVSGGIPQTEDLRAADPS